MVQGSTKAVTLLLASVAVYANVQGCPLQGIAQSRTTPLRGTEGRRGDVYLLSSAVLPQVIHGVPHVPRHLLRRGVVPFLQRADRGLTVRLLGQIHECGSRSTLPGYLVAEVHRGRLLQAEQTAMRRHHGGG